ncbi:MAG: hypothetical protein AAF223_10430, partial [Bacteroidota bacterium]
HEARPPQEGSAPDHAGRTPARLLLAGAIYQYRSSQKVTSRTRQDYRKIQHELEEFRKTSLEKERRLRRELQTERNLVEELKVTSQKR